MLTLVDTSVWIDYFRDGTGAEIVDFLIEENLVVVNDIILAELIPFLKIRKQTKIVDLLFCIAQIPLAIDWPQIISFQYTCLKNGINGVGIPDLLIAQNAKQNHISIHSLDGHFRLMENILGFETL